MKMKMEDSVPGLRRILLWLLTAALWLLSVGLGALALMALVRVVEIRWRAAHPAQRPGPPAANARGVLTVLRYATMLAGGLLLLMLAIPGMDFHFRHSGRPRSLRIFAVTFAVELALLVLERLVI